MTGNREDYIKAIYELGGEKNRISTKKIAKALDISAPSVSEMIKKLVDEGFIEYELYKGVILTVDGLREALHIKKRHILWEVFLVEKLGYKWEDVHEEAEILEHITSEKLERHLDRFLNFPKTCPHGTPIRDGSYLFDHKSLDNTELEKNVVIKRLEDDRDILKFSRQVDLNIGDRVEIIKRDKDENIKIIKDRKEIDIDRELAKKIYVN